MKQHKLEERGPLLNGKSKLNEKGYSTFLIKIYNRNDIKEWFSHQRMELLFDIQ